MFAKIFTFVVIAAHVTAEIPSYIHICDRKDPNYDQCIANSIKNIKDKVCTGFPELDIPPHEPFTADKIIFNISNNEWHITDVKIYGFCDFVINSVRADPESLHYNINITFRQLYINSTYDFDIRLLVPIVHKGVIEIFSENVGLELNLDTKMVVRNGKEHIFASKVNSKLNVTLFKYILNKNEKKLAELNKIIKSIIDNNIEEINDTIISVFEEKISRTLLLLFNNLTRSNYAKLFPKNR